MAIVLNKLPANILRTKLEPGRYSDGGGLYLRVFTGGSMAWFYMWKRQGKRRELGLGPTHSTDLATARIKAAEARRLVGEGKDPKIIRDHAKKVRQQEIEKERPTFKQAVTAFLKDREKQNTFKTEKTRYKWTRFLEIHAAPLNDILVEDMVTRDVYDALLPIWGVKPETANRTRSYIEAVMTYSKGMGWRSGDNPAQWRDNLSGLLTSVEKLRTVKHHASIDWRDMPAFMVDLRARQEKSALLMEFIILTACRSIEAREAVWSEICPAPFLCTILM